MSTSCPACGVAVVPGYVKCPRCGARLPSISIRRAGRPPIPAARRSSSRSRRCRGSRSPVARSSRSRSSRSSRRATAARRTTRCNRRRSATVDHARRPGRRHRRSAAAARPRSPWIPRRRQPGRRATASRGGPRPRAQGAAPVVDRHRERRASRDPLEHLRRSTDEARDRSSGAQDARRRHHQAALRGAEGRRRVHARSVTTSASPR